MKGTPIIINNRDRVSPLQSLVNWLSNAGYWNLIILDNDSTYPPLREFYRSIRDTYRIEFLGRNLGSKALWHSRVRHLAKPPFVYTDSDIVPTDECPADVLSFFLKVAESYPDRKVGFGLKIDDIPDHYSPCEIVRTWEGRYWKNQVDEVDDVPLYDAPIDTTFALYTDIRPFSYDAIRTGPPYVARHLPWYIDSKSPTEEDLHYEGRVSVGTHSWGIDTCLSKTVQMEYRRMNK